MKPLPAILIAGSLLGAFYVARWDARRQGRAEGRAEAGKARVETLTVRVQKLDTIYRDKLKAYDRWQTKYDSTHDTITITRDTGRVVYVSKALADTTIQLCRQALNACESSLHIRDSLILGLRGQLTLQKRAQPSRVSRILNNALWMGAGFTIGAVTGR